MSISGKKERKPRPWRRLAAFLSFSLLLHGLLFFLLPRESGKRAGERLYRVRFYPPPGLAELSPVQRFDIIPPLLLPKDPVEPLEAESGPTEVDAYGAEMEDAEDPNASEPPTRLAPDGLPDRRGATLTRPGDSRISQEELDRRAMQRQREAMAEREKRSWLWLPDADTTDAETRNRRKAEEIVDRAIEAMGGLERMLAVRDKQVTVLHYDSKTNQWFPGEERYYLRGEMFREDLSRGISWGYDGKASWSYYFGILLPSPDLRDRAERWDFLNQFKGEGVLLSYGGRGKFDQRAVEIVEVEDLKYDVYRQAYFDMASHLLVGLLVPDGRLSALKRGTKSGNTEITYVEYKRTGDLLLPYEFFFRKEKRAWRDRHETLLDTGLEPSFFRAPRPRTWDPAAMAILLKDGAPSGSDVSSTRSLDVAEIYQAPAPPVPQAGDGGVSITGAPIRPIYSAVRIDHRSLHLLNTYLSEKLRLAGVFARQEADYQVEVCIAEFWMFARPLSPPIYAMKLRIEIQPPSGFPHVIEATHRWEGVMPIDDRLADTITSLIMTALGRGLVEWESEVAERPGKP